MDKDLGKVLNDFSALINLKKNFLNNIGSINAMIIDDKDLNDIVLYNNLRVDLLGLYFNIPGYCDVELKPDGLNTLLDANNINEYVNLAFDSFCGSGVQEIIEEFTNGFNCVFPITHLRCFTSKEIEDILSNNHEEDWTYETLSEYIIPNHGYNKFRYASSCLI